MSKKPSPADPDRVIVETAKRRIAESLPTIPLERIQDLKILADIIDACSKRTAKAPDAPDPMEILLSLIRSTASLPSSTRSSPTRSGDSDAAASTAYGTGRE